MRRITDLLRGPEAAASSAALRTVAAFALAASLLFVGLIVVSLFRDGGSDTEVLGSRDERPGEVTGEAAPPEGTIPTDPGGDLEVASTDGGAFFVYAEDPSENVEGSATVIEQGEGGVSLTVSGFAGDRRATIRATVENEGGNVIVFEDGLSVAVHVDHDGVAWRTVEPADRSITELRPGERASVSTEVELGGFGHYDLTGDVFFARR